MKAFDTNPKHLVWPLVAAISLGLTGCGSDSKNRTAPTTDGTTDGTTTEGSPTVASTGPADKMVDVALNTMVVATFNNAIDADSISSAGFTLAAAGLTDETGTVTVDTATNTASFDPTSNLVGDSVYTATISTDVKSLEGIAMDNNYVWTFTTGLIVDVTPPAVASTDAADQDTDVSTNRNVSVVFSEKMNPATINSTTFTLTGPAGAVPGVVSYPGTTAQFNPDQDLDLSTQYTATITTGAEDLAANALAASFVWSFTTGTTPAMGPAPVNLGTAGNYVILAKTMISTTGTTKIIGDIAISPAAETFITGFSQARDSSGTFATTPSDILTGRIYAADMTPPTPAILTTAISDMEIAFTDAASRTTPDYTELGAGDVSGQVLEPGLYKWGTSLLMTSAVTLNGDANDVWIFQIAQDLTVENGVDLILAGGALAKNIFWQVGGAVSLGTTSDFDGIILSQTAIVVKTGATLNGRALAQSAVTLDANAVTAPAL
ncbi:ice-binding family protein [Allohahella marinimesophila]